MGKITGKEGTRFVGPARCFDQEEDMMEAVANDAPQFKGCVIVIRYEGPKGGPGMKEMLTPTSAAMGAGLGKGTRAPPPPAPAQPHTHFIEFSRCLQEWTWRC